MATADESVVFNLKMCHAKVVVAEKGLTSLPIWITAFHIS